MPDDLLAPFRRPGETAPASSTKPVDPPYRAFAAAQGARPLRLELRPKDGLAVARLYSALAEIAYDRADYAGILLLFPAGQAVRVKGRNLQPVVTALLAGTCEYLCEARAGDEAGDEEPVIETLELLQPKTGSA